MGRSVSKLLNTGMGLQHPLFELEEEEGQLYQKKKKKKKKKKFKY
jgi:hypothetical protein